MDGHVRRHINAPRLGVYGAISPAASTIAKFASRARWGIHLGISHEYKGPAPSGVSQVDAVEPVEVAADSGASGGAEPERAEPGGAESGGAEPERAESGGAEPGGAEPGGAEPERAEPGGAGAQGPGGARPGGTGAAGPGGAPGAGATGGARAGGATGAEATGGAGAGGAPGVGATGGTGAGAAMSTSGSAGAGAAGGTGAGGAAGAGADAGDPGVVPAGSGGAARLRPYFVPLLEQVLGLPPSPSPAPSSECPPPVRSESQLQLVSPLPAPSPYAGPTGGLAERREPESRPALPVCTARTSRRVPRQRPPVVSGTHQMALRPSIVPQCVPLPPTVTRVLATVVTDPSFESAAASALVAELVNFAAHCRLDYAASLVAESASVCPPSVGGECALSTDVLEDRQEEFQCFAAALPHLAAMDAEMASWKSTGTYVDEVPPPGANIVSGMWIFRVKRPPGSPPVFKARYVARGFSQRHGVDYFQTFSPTPKMTTLRVLLHVAAQRDYELHSLDFSTAFLQGSLHEEIWLRRPPDFTGSFPPGPSALRLHVLLASGHSSVYSPLALALPSDESVEPSGPYPELVGCLMYLMTCTRLDLAYPLSILARYVAPGRHRPEHMAAAKRVLRYLCSTSGLGLVLGGRSPVVLIGHADASWKLRWLTYLLTDLGEPPCSPPVLYVDNKAMLALCREHRLEHRTKHIALRYFLARELQQRGQLRLAYVASQANTADIFTKALQPCV
ncbi:unnamed protein product [Closterium sp. NIES-54]